MENRNTEAQTERDLGKCYIFLNHCKRSIQRSSVTISLQLSQLVRGRTILLKAKKSCEWESFQVEPSSLQHPEEEVFSFLLLLT